MVPSERTVTVGVGHGKKAARHIDAWLRGQPAVAKPKHPAATFDKLHLWYFGDAARRQQPELAPQDRVPGFAEVVGGLSAAAATFEAGRCLSCGNCFECDGCLGACPEDAVIKLGPGHRYEFDYDRCTGCGACLSSARCHAIEMVRTERAVTRDDNRRRQRSCGLGRLPAQRGLLHLPDHAVLADGGAGRRVVEPGPAQRLGHGAHGRRDAERGRGRRRPPRSAAERRARDDVHRVAGPAADDPEHVQDRRRADLGGDSRRRALPCRAGAFHLRRPLRRDGRAPDRLRPAGRPPRSRRRTTSRWSPRRRRCGPGCRSCTSSTASAPLTS